MPQPNTPRTTVTLDTLVDLDGPGADLTEMPSFSGTLAQASVMLIPGTYTGVTYQGRALTATVTDGAVEGHYLD